MRMHQSHITDPMPRGERVDEAATSLSNYPASLVEATLERLLGSRTFGRSQRHRRFLQHVIEAALSGRRDRLKEIVIGIEVFERALPRYDPRRDPIVRVEAGRIRDKLARFYAAEGAGETFRIVLPIGHYLPLFVRHTDSVHVAPAARLHAVAVLPFANLSRASDDASLVVGLANQLIDTLGRVPYLRVVSRTSVSGAHDAGIETMDTRAIGRLLGVDHVVEGSLQRSGGRLRCIVQIVRTKDSLRLWSRRFEHDLDQSPDLFDFQDEIADAVMAFAPALRESA
jgi:TolB-like protein